MRPPRRGEQGKKRLAQGKASTLLRSGGPRLPLATMTPVSGFYTKRAECCEWNPGGVRFNHSSVPDFQVTLWPASYTSHQGPQRCGKKFKKQNKTRKPLNLCSFRKLVGGGKRMWAKRGSGGVMEAADTPGGTSVPCPWASSRIWADIYSPSIKTTA